MKKSPKMPTPKIPIPAISPNAMNAQNMGQVPTNAPVPAAPAIAKGHANYDRHAASPMANPSPSC